MTASRDGQIVTFYSYKGGTGRTMALANVAWILAANGKRVLTVDWDLESPGLHRFFSPFIDPDVLTSTRGVIDMIREYEWATTRTDAGEDWLEQYAGVRRHSFSLDWGFPNGGSLDYLSAGQQNHEYAGILAETNWDDFYQHQDGGKFFDAMRADMKRWYDYTLIDSRTGHSDVAAICTSHLPDVLVDCFTFSEQGIDGAAQMARQLLNTYGRRKVRIFPVPMRVDPAEKRKADAGRAVAMHRFQDLPVGMADDERRAYWNSVQVPYQAYYAYEETLATFGDGTGLNGSLLSSYENLTRYLTDGAVDALPPMDDNVRIQVNLRFERRPLADDDVVVLANRQVDQVWGEWIEHILSASGLRVVHGDADADAPAILDARPITVVSRSNAETERQRDVPWTGPHPPIAVYVADVTPIHRFAAARSAFIAGLAPATAAGRIMDIVGRPIADMEATLAGAPRYPGDEPQLLSLPARNARFTGREAGLRELREQLRSGASVVLFGIQSVTLQGMGGVGKTQLALEYAHRYRTAYDVVYWLNADSTENLEASLRDLGNALNLQTEQSGPEHARAVVHELSRDKRRWLLIFDNADEPEMIRAYMPHGPGHLLITSRNLSWSDRALPIQVDVFQRRESIEHLIQRAPAMGREDADRVAEQLADLPIAIAAAGAWLAETGTPVEEYLHQIRAEGPSAALAASSDVSIARTWDLSLNRLRDRDPAAYRLFQLCSVLAPEIALDLIYSDRLADFLAPYNPAVSERLLRGSLVQQINRLALLRLDQRPNQSRDGNRGGQVLVHRVVQNVVRDRMTEQELAEARDQVHQVLATARPDGEVDQQEDWPRFRILWPHLDVSDAVRSTRDKVRQLIIDRVRYQYLIGDMQAGRERAERSVAIWTAQLDGITDPDDRRRLRRQILSLRFNLANLLRDLGEFEQSRRVDEEVLAEQADLLGARHPHTLMTAGGLAGDLRGLGRYPEALERDLATHAAWLDEYGEDHPRTLSALNNLAVDYRLMGQFRTALAHDEEVLRRRHDVLGETNLFTLASAAGVARDVRDAGEYTKSVAMLQQTLHSVVETRGPNSKAALTTQSNYAVSLRSAGDLDEAVRLHEAAYKQLDDILGPSNPETVSCRLSLALSHLAAGHTEQAATELREIEIFYEQRLSPRHPYTLVCMNDLAIAERALDRLDGARDWATAAADGLREVLGPEHPYTLSAQMNLAICLADAEDLTAARDLLTTTVEPILRVLGPEHPNAMRCEANLALVDRALGNPTADARIASLRDRIAERVAERHPIVEGLRRHRYLYRIIDPHQF